MHKLKEINVADVSLLKSALEKLEKNKINTIYDLLMSLPKRYENFELEQLDKMVFDKEVFIEVRIISVPKISRFAPKKSIIRFKATHNSSVFNITLFNRDFVFRNLKLEQTIYVKGRFSPKNLDFNVSVLKFDLPTGSMKPHYGLKEITNVRFSKILLKIFSDYEHLIKDPLPIYLRQKYKLISLFEALKLAHFPESSNDIKEFKRRIKYGELFEFQLKLQLQLNSRLNILGEVINVDEEKINHFIKTLPFELTNDQVNATTNILSDLKSNNQMNRLVQGDVGCGKTVVATVAAYATILDNKQVAFMVPTEVLAKQQYNSFLKAFNSLDVEIALLTSSVKGKKRKEILSRLSSGEIDILIGTHALITDEVEFKNLAFAVIDEQQRFGVNQRRLLREKGEKTNLLYMSATPIPRTLALAFFKDIDITIIKEMPKGRKSIKTYAFSHEQLNQVYNSLRREMGHGNQVYVVTPLIEESEVLDLQNAVSLYEELEKEFLNEHKVGLMHGKLHNDDKQAIMQQFVNNQIQLLVSTTVIEVGVDIPNATVMLIVDAHRFGISQLHQLRGRVGRGDKQSYCILITDSEKIKGNPRIKAMVKTNDGFVLSEYDMKLRGPGDFFGVNQAGLPQFVVADLSLDYKVLEIARDDVYEILSKRDSVTFEVIENYDIKQKFLD